MREKSMISMSKDYFNLLNKEKESAISYLLEALIRSREENHFPSNKKIYDEDVNIYLAHLLLAYATSSYQDLVAKYLSAYDSEIRELVDSARDRYVKYFIFKVNADYLLIHLGVFQDLGGVIRFGSRSVNRSERYFAQNAISYYQEAANYNQKIYHKKTAVKDVLEKLADYFDDYRDLLKKTRSHYFHFMNHFEDNEFKNFTNSIASYEKEFSRKELENKLLDLYLEWKKKPTPELESLIRIVVGEIQKMDPVFRFQI
ncbi:MAG: hypothetical protein HZC17_08255 [Candidatus Omnitrophica bacterium]|nr:hypothetical protein [Candidatus Omnitrophota bacterium]